MKTELLEKLLDAGFSKDEIIALARDEPMNAPAAAADPAAAEATAEQAAADPAAAEVPSEPAAVQKEKEPEPVNDKMSERLSLIEGNLEKLTRAIQANAVAQSSFPGETQNAPTAEDMLAEIIRPKISERG